MTDISLKTQRYNVRLPQQTTKEYVNSTLRWKYQVKTIPIDADLYLLSPPVVKLPDLKSHGTQTVQRESEAQTDPFSPQLATRHSDLEALASLRWGVGLSGNKSEFEYIRMLLEKKKRIDIIPENQVKQKFTVMRELEVEEAEFKDKVNQRLVQERIDVITDELKRKQEQRRQATEERIQEYQRQKEQSILQMKDKIQRRKDKFILALAERKKSHTKNELSKRIQAFHVALTSVEAQDSRIERHQLLHLSGLQQSAFDDQTLAQLNGQVSKLQFAQTPSAKRLMEPSKFSSKMLQERRWREKLDVLAKDYDVSRPQQTAVENHKLRFLTPKVPKIIRPTTPIIDPIISVAQSDHEADIIMLQRTLRGLAVKNEMDVGVSKNMALLNELQLKREEGQLQSLEDLSASLAFIPAELQNPGVGVSSRRPSAIPPAVLSRRGTLLPFASALAGDKIVSTAEDTTAAPAETVAFDSELFEAFVFAPYIGRSLDFLDKDIVRHRELAKLSIIVQEAIAHRQRLEQAESEKRTQELALRTKIDSVYSELMDVHTETALTFIDDCFKSAVEEKAAEAASQVEFRYKHHQSEDDVMTDLREFMMVEVEKQINEAIVGSADDVIQYTLDKVFGLNDD